MGCESQERTQDVLQVLERGRAKGNLIITTGGRVSAGMRNTFFAGADDSTVAFDGEIDFRDALLEESTDVVD